jgi:uncharacterized protein involved in exopolysaccharide biosynthesis
MRNLIETEINTEAAGRERELQVESLAAELELAARRARRGAQARLLWRRRQFLGRAAALGCVLSAAVALLIPPEFQASVRLMPPDSDAGNGLALLAALGGPSGGLGAMAGDLLGVKSSGALFLGVLRSRTVEDRVIERFNLKKEYGTRYDDLARQRLEANTAVSEDRKSGIIALSVTDHSAARAAGMAGAYVDELNSMLVQLNTSSAHRERVFLEERLQAVRQGLEQAEHDFGEFASKNGALDIGEQGKAMVGAAASLEGQLVAAQSELQGLKQIYTDENVRVRSTQARLDELRSELQKLSGRMPGGSAAGNAAGVAPDGPAEANEIYPNLRELPLLGVPYADKYRQLKVEEAIYETLTKEYELAKVQEAKEIPAVKVLDPPEVPEHKSYPPRLMIIFSGSAAAAALGAGWVLGAARWRELDAGDARKALALEAWSALREMFSGKPAGKRSAN